MRIGIDFGGVLSIHDGGGRSQSQEHGSTVINIPGGVSALQRLKTEGHSLHLISFCGKRRAEETKATILASEEARDLFDGLHFVKKASLKGEVCKHIGIDVMIDDRLDVLIPCVQSGTPTVFWFKGDPNFEDNSSTRLPQVRELLKWDDVHALLVGRPGGREAQPVDGIGKILYKLD
jgi:hypothetical protein